MGPFKKRNVLDQVVQYPNRFKINGVSQTIEPDFGIVEEEGTLINRAHLQPIEDALEEISILPTGTGLVAFVCVDANGDPIVGVKISGFSTPLTTNGNGIVCEFLSIGSHTFTLDLPVGYESTTDEVIINVASGERHITSILINKVLSGSKIITASQSFYLADWISSFDAFAIGGGGSGGSVAYATSGGSFGRAVASGGGSGRTSTALNITNTGELITVNIGAGGGANAGSSSVSSDGSLQKAGLAGGTTTLIRGSTTILSAVGGSGGSTNINTDTISGANGGCGSGGVLSGVSQNGGTNGSNGSGTNGGVGQGTTTKTFGESGGTLYGGAGAGANTTSTGTKSSGVGGANGGGNGNSTVQDVPGSAGTLSLFASGIAGTQYGAGGGASASNLRFGIANVNLYTSCGLGYQGMVEIRWGV